MSLPSRTLGPSTWEAVPLGRGPGQSSRTYAGVPVFGQLVALAAVALVGAVDVGALLAAALCLTLVHICEETSQGMWGGGSSQPRDGGQGPTSSGAYLEGLLVSASPLGHWGLGGPEKDKKPARGMQLRQGQQWGLLVESRPDA